jgi:hypothetical protein
VLPPTREHALILALRHARTALVAIDDANIPTVGRYCTRLAGQNDLPMFRSRMDHGVCFFAATGAPLDESRTLKDTLKVMRFALVGRKYLP